MEFNDFVKRLRKIQRETLQDIIAIKEENEELKERINYAIEYLDNLKYVFSPEELKQHPEIKYVYIYETKPYVDITPKITW